MLLLLGVAAFAAALTLVGADSWNGIAHHGTFIAISGLGLLAAAFFPSAHGPLQVITAVYSQWALLLAYCALLIGPASQVYRQVDRWQDLAKIGRAIERDTVGRPLILLAPDETTRAIIDMYARTSVEKIPGPLDAAGIERVRAAAAAAPDGFFLVQLAKQSPPGLPWRTRAPEAALPAWIPAANPLQINVYSVPYGRRYALLRLKD